MSMVISLGFFPGLTAPPFIDTAVGTEAILVERLLTSPVMGRVFALRLGATEVCERRSALLIPLLVLEAYLTDLVIV